MHTNSHVSAFFDYFLLLYIHIFFSMQCFCGWGFAVFSPRQEENGGAAGGASNGEGGSAGGSSMAATGTNGGGGAALDRPESVSPDFLKDLESPLASPLIVSEKKTNI